MNDKGNEFAQGVAYAAAEMERTFDQLGYAMHLLNAAGLTTAAELRKAGVDEYDRKACRRVLRKERRP